MTPEQRLQLPVVSLVGKLVRYEATKSRFLAVRKIGQFIQIVAQVHIACHQGDERVLAYSLADVCIGRKARRDIDVSVAEQELNVAMGQHPLTAGHAV